MIRFATRKWLPWLTWTVAGVALIRCSGGTEYVLEGVAEEAPLLGTAGFHLDVGDGLVFNQLTATLQFPDTTFQTQTLDVSPDDSSLTLYLGELPVGTGYQVTLSATSTTGAECTGSSQFRINQDETVVVNVRMQCSGGVAQPDVGAAVVKGEVVPATGDCPAVLDRIELSPAKAGIGVPVRVEVFPTTGTAPLVTFSASGGQLQIVSAAPAAGGAPAGGGAQGAAGSVPASQLGTSGDDDEVAPAVTLARGTSTRATFRCTTAGEFEVYAEAIRAGCVHETHARIRCFDDGTPFPTGGTGGGGGQGGGNSGGSAGSSGGGAGGVAGGTNNACTTCTASSCPAQLSACQNDPTSAACQEIRVCAAVGTAASCASNSSLDCYCGTRPIATCLTFGGNGECSDVITRASGCNDGRAAENIPMCVSERFLEVNFGLGDAFQLVACQRRNCSTQCGLVP